MRTYTDVTSVTPRPGGGFKLGTRDERGAQRRFAADTVVPATGCFEHPKRLGVEGEDLCRVSHYAERSASRSA